jgi:hypothetical protein
MREYEICTWENNALMLKQVVNMVTIVLYRIKEGIKEKENQQCEVTLFWYVTPCSLVETTNISNFSALKTEAVSSFKSLVTSTYGLL